MKDANGSEDWRVLCELASKEKDPKKMLDLITKINQALEDFHHKPSSPVSTNAHFYSIPPVISLPVQCWARNLRLALGFFDFLPKPICHPPHPISTRR
jgi:hypothetical protein